MTTMAVTYINFNGMMVGEIRSGVVTDYLPDTQGSLIGTVNSSGAVVSTADYYPFGEVASSTGTNPSPWGFIGLLGYFADVAIRLYVRSRVVRTDLAAWMTVDPLWPSEAAYEYCLGSPLVYVDPAGLGFSKALCCLDAAYSSFKSSAIGAGVGVGFACFVCIVLGGPLCWTICGIGAIGGIIGVITGALETYKSCMSSKYQCQPPDPPCKGGPATSSGSPPPTFGRGPGHG